MLLRVIAVLAIIDLVLVFMKGQVIVIDGGFLNKTKCWAEKLLKIMFWKLKVSDLKNT